MKKFIIFASLTVFSVVSQAGVIRCAGHGVKKVAVFSGKEVKKASKAVWKVVY